jgi:p-hydroxybenzoate 3-monooxygenase
MDREGIVHHGIELQFDEARHRIDLTGLTGASLVIYGQTEVVKDLIAIRLGAGEPLLFEASDVSVHGLEGSPRIRFTHEGAAQEIECDLIAGCDGYHGVCRPSIPAGVLRETSREYPFGWLGILAAVAPSNDVVVYSHHPRGFSLLSMRSPSISRLYLQVAPDEDLAGWPDDRIWEELQLRLGVEGWTLAEGRILEKGVTGMRSYVCEPMQFGNLYLAGDAAHIVPPTGAKGLNLAINDVRVLAEAIVSFYETGSRAGLDGYSDTCLRRVWRAQHFSWWMTSMLHRLPGNDPFDLALQLSQLRSVAASEAAARVLAENYVGIAPV